MEIFKDVIGFEGVYQISNLGNLKSFKRNTNGEILKACNDGKGYTFFYLYNDKRNKHTTHRIVAEHFIPNPENKPCVNHINGITHDNNAENLEWVTYSENNIHAFKIGLAKKGEHHYESIKVIDAKGNIYQSMKEASISNGLNRSYASQMIRGILKNTHGFRHY